MTDLLKPITRLLLATEQFGSGKVRGRRIAVTLMAGDVIQFRYKGTRQTFECSLHSCLMLAKVITWDKDYDRRMDEYKRKRAAGVRCRKPKRGFIRVSPQLAKAAVAPIPKQ